jgi:hypothetical protein
MSTGYVALSLYDESVQDDMVPFSEKSVPF